MRYSIQFPSLSRIYQAVFVIHLILLISIRAGAEDSTQPVRRQIISNAVRLIMKPEAASEVVAISIYIRMEANVRPGDEAIGEIVSHSLFGSSLNQSRDAIVDSISRVGGRVEIVRTPQYVAIHCTTLPHQIKEAIYLLTQTLKNADFAPGALDRACQNILLERSKRKRNDFIEAYHTLKYQLQGIAEPDDRELRQVTTAQAMEYFRAHYLPERTVVAIVGHFDPVQVQTSFDNQFFDYDRKALRAPRFTVDNSLESPDVKLERRPYQPGTTIAYAMAAAAAPGLKSPDYPAFTVLKALLGGGHASRLFRRIRDEQGLGYNVGAIFQPELSDPLIAYLSWDISNSRAGSQTGKPFSPKEALEKLTDQLMSVQTDSPNETEITRARNVAIGQFALRHERAQERASLFAWYEVMGVGYGYDSTFPQLLASVRREDVLRVSRIYIASLSTLIVVPPTH